MKKIIVSLIVVGVMVFLGFKLIEKKKLEELKEKTPTIYPLNVEAIRIKEKNVTLTLPYLAEAKSIKNVTISSKFGGKVLYIANVGDSVKKGDVVLKVDDKALKAKLKEVNSNINSIKALIDADKINLKNLEAMHLRTKKLLEVKMASIEQWENEKSKIASLKAKIKSQEEKLNSLYALKKSILNDISYLDVRSPIDGVVSFRFVNKNDVVAPFRPVLKISNKKSYLFLALGEDIRGVIYKNKFLKAIPLDDTLNGLKTYKVNIKDNLLAGEKVKVDAVVFRGYKTFVPFGAILNVNNSSYIIFKDGEIKKVHIIASGKEGVVIKEDINASVIKASPDILLKIKAGYPMKIKDEDV